MPKEIVTNGPFKSGDAWVVVGWSRGQYAQVGVQSEEPESGLFTDLDREGINKLIRLLRKARDQAYGADA